MQPIGIYPGKYQWAGKPSLGDCSLEVREANITFDDGEWECQVTSSSFASQDALASKPARLVVRGESSHWCFVPYHVLHTPSMSDQGSTCKGNEFWLLLR